MEAAMIDERTMTDDEINEFIEACFSDWLGSGATQGDLLAIVFGIATHACDLFDVPNDNAHELLAVLLSQRQGGRNA
jgi:hypothetical protein